MQLQLKIQLQGISKPPVWRRVLIPNNFNFHQLHAVIQAAFGWGNYHLYQFSENGYGSEIFYGISDPDFPDDVVDSRKIKCADILTYEGQHYTYVYDFGDDWIHKITIEKVIDEKALNAELIDGKGSCPPEDCGGPGGYKHLLDILSDLTNKEYKQTRKMIGLSKNQEWDVNYFDLETAKQRVAQLH